MYLLEVFSVPHLNFADGEKTLFSCTYSKCFLSYLNILLLEKNIISMYLLEVLSVILFHFAAGEKTLFPCTSS